MNNKIIELKDRIRTQIICPECECECWFAFKDTGYQCAECGYSGETEHCEVANETN